MATIHNHVDSSTSTNTGPWLTTYSRALSSIYGTDEDHCWDSYLLSSSTSIDPPTSRSATPANSNNNNNTNSLYYPSDMVSTLAPTSPASLSHALCRFGFDCIDYFTSSHDNDDNDEGAVYGVTPTNTPAANSSATQEPPVYTSPMLDELTESDWRTGLAAAVCGKRTAALERKRALSRTMSQDEFLVETVASSTADTTTAVGTITTDSTTTVTDIATTNPTDRLRKRDPWFEALDRLARWDEVAYR
ncbi:hypothetical protein BGX29_009760 [Mortierella sp. GBA35]|nr:hypothetical protein BGX29_009760 [Mortierella sp. GBA35]